jgi:hypothetical protein
MKISRNILVLSSFIITFAILMIVFAVTGRFFEPAPMKALLIATYFAGWVAFFVFCVCVFFPKVQAAGGLSAMFHGTHKIQEEQEKSESFTPEEEIQKRSPRSELPVRERIAAYVMERRREEGIPAPSPLYQSSIEERQSVSPGRFSPASVTQAAAASVTSLMNNTEAFSEFDGVLDFDLMPDREMETNPDESAYEPAEFDGHLNLDLMHGEDAFGANDLDSLADIKDLDLDEPFDHAFEKVLEFNASTDNEELLLSEDDFEDIGEIIDLEPDDMDII